MAGVDYLGAFVAHMPIDDLSGLLAELKSCVLKQGEVRLVPSDWGGYSWTLPHVARSVDSLYERELVLNGNGPDISPFFPHTILQRIDNQLRSATPAYNGFDGLCAALLLPARRTNLKSSFRLSAHLPASLWRVELYPRRRAIEVKINCVGVPDIMVEWFPSREFQKIPTEWVTDTANGVPRSASLPIPDDFVTGARLILAFGDSKPMLYKSTWRTTGDQNLTCGDFTV